MLKVGNAVSRLVTKRCIGSGHEMGKIYHPSKIGNREVVGFGINGKAEYLDSVTFPFPSIKYKSTTADTKALQEKEKGDWKQLSTAEKKQLYRISYGQTFSEIEAPTGEWKSVIGFGLIAVSLGVWLHLLVEWIKSEDGWPVTFELESQKAQLRRILDLQMNPVTGISSKWDYEKEMWKKDVPKSPKDN